MLPKKILVTGGAGYIGSHTNALLNALGFSSVVLDNLSLGHKESLHFKPLDSHFLPEMKQFFTHLNGGGGRTQSF